MGPELCLAPVLMSSRFNFHWIFYRDHCVTVSEWTTAVLSKEILKFIPDCDTRSFTSFFIVNADIFYNLTLWKFYIYDHIIHVIKKLLFCILSLLKENANSVNQAKDHLHHQEPFVWCSLSRPVHDVIFLQKQLSSDCYRIYMYLDVLQNHGPTWGVVKTTGTPEGSFQRRATEPGFDK